MTADQRANHDRLLRRYDWNAPARFSGRPLDAIIVPASRRAAHLGGLIDLASVCETTLVVLASHSCDVEEAAEMVAGRPGAARVVLAEVTQEAGHAALRLETSAEEIRGFSAERSSNLSLKRNIGLLLARYRGWQKIMFLDDDITRITPDHVTRVAHRLDTNAFAGLKTVAFPDNSVVCHANRLAGRPQGIFVSGAALGVNTAADRPLDVFPDVYNEDWFALSREAQCNGIAHVGNIGQLEFNPFEDPGRAKFEEFGDLIAEGLYALFNEVGEIHRATVDYWKQFKEQRLSLIVQIRRLLERHETHQSVQAVKSLNEARLWLEMTSPESCSRFLEVWQDDRRRFEEASRAAAGQALGYGGAFDALGLPKWREARFGMTRMYA